MRNEKKIHRNTTTYYITYSAGRHRNPCGGQEKHRRSCRHTTCRYFPVKVLKLNPLFGDWFSPADNTYLEGCEITNFEQTKRGILIELLGSVRLQLFEIPVGRFRRWLLLIDHDCTARIFFDVVDEFQPVIEEIMNGGRDARHARDF